MPRVLAAPRWRAIGADLMVLGLLVFLNAMVGRRIGELPSASPPSAVLVAVAVYLAVVAGGCGLLFLTARSLRTRPDTVDLTVPRSSRVWAVLATQGQHAWVLLAMAISTLPLAVVTVLGLGFDTLRIVARDGNVIFGAAGVVGFVDWLRLVADGMGGIRGTGRPRPLDRVATQLTVVAASVRRAADDPEAIDHADVRWWVGSLERSARDAGRFALRSVPWWDWEARHAAHLDGLRLAAVVRAHKTPLTRAMSGDDFAKVANSLTAGLDAWSRGDFAALVRNAPEVTRRARLRPVLARLGPPAILIGSGIVLPLLPPLNAAPEAAASARTALLVGAAMVLATGSAQQAPDYLKTVLEKTVLPK
ncbi:hypothetical protein [Actinoallomurus iriomotensis]|uniref:hypothetical protein n=1 Tax=Actinoallomurus iriomotensis TaxID=478107 RepID=UPI0025568743|nr:hypothetical protein [Actinoallomurus iriomotensis]